MAKVTRTVEVEYIIEVTDEETGASVEVKAGPDDLDNEIARLTSREVLFGTPYTVKLYKRERIRTEEITDWVPVSRG